MSSFKDEKFDNHLNRLYDFVKILSEGYYCAKKETGYDRLNELNKIFWELFIVDFGNNNIALGSSGFRFDFESEIKTNIELFSKDQYLKYKNYLIAKIDLFDNRFSAKRNEIDEFFKKKNMRFTDMKGLDKITKNQKFNIDESIQLFYDFYTTFKIQSTFFRNTIEDILEEIEPMPEFEIKNPTQKIAWLNELGILELVLNKTTNNYTRAAQIIHTFTDINVDTIRKSMEDIFKPNKENEKNNPYKNDSNKEFISEMIMKFKLINESEEE